MNQSENRFYREKPVQPEGKKTPEFWADWLVDAVATATQDGRFLKGDPSEDRVAIDAIYLNGKRAIENYVAAIERGTE